VFIIERDFMKASAFALAGAAMTFFGFMHGERIGLGESPAVAMSYLAVAVIFPACAHFVTAAVAQPREVRAEPHAEELAV
jgi:AGZA family xanthine/uracil permease-like MFS transporter